MEKHVIDASGFWLGVFPPGGISLADGWRIVESPPPLLRTRLDQSGLISPRWSSAENQWIESACAEEILAWETEMEKSMEMRSGPGLDGRLALVEMDTAAITAALERGLAM